MCRLDAREQRRTLAARMLGRRELGAMVVLVDEKPRLSTRARQGGVAPTGGEVAGRGDDDRPLDRASLHAVGGESVGVLEVL
jgi:hypothetical protein